MTWYIRVPALPWQPSQPVWSCRPEGGEVVEDEEISDTFLQHTETQEECAHHEWGRPQGQGQKDNLSWCKLYFYLLQLVGYLHSIEDKEFVEAKDFLKKYYLNCIANVGFGINIDCFDEKKSEFEKMSA